jgi:DNA-binding transcriptional LysR family regulator
MELYQLRTFAMVAEVGNLTRAAERLHTSQPAVSAHIKALEAELGLSLFERTPKGMQLTPAGAALKAKAAVALSAADAVRFEAKRLKDELTGTLRLGLHIDPQYLRVADLLTVLGRAHPGLKLHYLQRMTWEAPDELRASRLDAAFVNRVPEGAEFVAHHLETLSLVIAAPMAWKNRLQNSDWDTIISNPWVWAHPLCPIYGVADHLFAQLGHRPVSAVMADEESAIRNLVTCGAGLTLMMEKEARDPESDGKFYIVREDVGTVDLSLVYLRQRADDPLISAILHAVKTVWNLD